MPVSFPVVGVLGALFLDLTGIVFAVVRIIAAFGLLPFLTSFALTFRIRTVLLFVGDSGICAYPGEAGH